MPLDFPHIDPVALTIPAITLAGITAGPFMIRWYALAYLTGFLAGWRYALRLNRLYGTGMISAAKIDDFITWVVLGVVAGGRIGYVLFYNFDYFIDNPLHVFRLWEGGMSFHGGAAGVIIAIIAFARYHRINMFVLADIVCACVPIGLLLGRLANFVNAELYGRVTNVPWAMVFPDSDGQPRHPSQLYEAASEGLLLFVILGILMRFEAVRNRPGIISAVFLAGYGLCRFMIEFVREPDAQLGTLSIGLTMGQMLCLPMILGGLLVVAVSRRFWVK